MNFRSRFFGMGKMLALFAILIFFSGCKNDVHSDHNGNSLDNTVAININDRQQVIRNFGASDAWTCQFVGLWPDDKRNQIADWLFSKEVDGNGTPRGIGLSLWRFNIGAGSASQ